MPPAQDKTPIIRPYDRKKDDKLVRFTVGRACVNSLATANKKLFFHPITLSIWFALSCMLIQYLNWWPNPALPWWTYLVPIPSFAAFAVPIMFAIDWYNRSSFEARAANVLRRPDMYHIENYYTRSPASGVWIFEYGEQFLGMIAVDASMDSLSEDTLNDASKDDKKYLQNKWKKGTSNIASIRHFYAMEQYRSANVQDDLLEFAVNQVFNADKTIKSIQATECTLDTWATKALQNRAFVIAENVGKVGLLGWDIRTRVLTRKKWEEREKAKGMGEKEI